jgi:serine protease Do
VQQLLRSGRVTRGWIGVSIQPLDDDIAHSLGLEETRGALVASVVPDGPAARAGIQQGDVILTLDGQNIEDSRDLTQRVGATPVGRTSRVEVLRNGARRTLQLRLAERPSEQVLASATQTPEATPEQPGGVAQSSLGLSVRPMTPEDRTRYQLGANESGLVVTSVDPASDAAEKGVRAGDIILQAGGHSIRTAQELTAAADSARRAGRPLLLQIDGRAGRRFIAADVSE